MNIINLLITLTYFGFSLIFFFIMWKHRAASPIFWYPIILLLIFSGISQITDFSHKGDELHLLLNFSSGLIFMTTVVTYIATRKIDKKLYIFKNKKVIEDNNTTKIVVLCVYIACIAASAIYFWMTGTNLIIMALTSGIHSDYSTIRLAMYSGDTYMAAGYFNQFKNFLLPLSSSLIAIYLLKSNKKIGILFSIVSAILCGLAVAGTGQRTYLIYAFFATLFGFTLLNLGKRSIISWRLITSIILLGLAFTIMTSLYKETDSFSEALALSFKRIFYVQQNDSIYAFRFIYDRQTVWFEDWKDSILGIMPWHRGGIIAHEIHDFLYTSFRGTVPPTLVASAYYNGGPTLVVITFFLLAIIYSISYEIFLNGPRTPSRCLTFGAIFFYFATFFVGSPRYLFDNGVVTFIFFLFLIQLFSNTKSKVKY